MLTTDKKMRQSLPILVLYLTLAMACSSVWLYSFRIRMLDDEKATSSQQQQQRKSLIFAYFIHIHILVLILLPFCSRPWLWRSKEEDSILIRVLWRVLGWDQGGDHWCYCLLEGMRPVASFVLAWAPFVYAANMAEILGLALEGFFIAEMVKHTEAEHGFFMCQMVSAMCAAQRLFDGGKWWTVISVCLFLIVLRSVLPFYEDVSTLLPEPYRPDAAAAAVGVVDVVCQTPPSAQVMSQEA